MTPIAGFLEGLSAELAPHAAVLGRVITVVEADPRWRWLELCCSIAQGAGDADSDLDPGLGVAEAAWPAALDEPPTQPTPT
jgi:hypothetical protein